MNRTRFILAAMMLILVWLAMAPAMAAADVVVPPSASPSTLPSSTPTSASPAALPASPGSSLGGGALAATVAGGIAVVALGAASWVVLRRVAARRAGRQAAPASIAGEAGDTEELD